MDFLQDLDTQYQDVGARLSQRRQSTHAGDALGEAQLREDERRLNLLAQLRQTAADPAREARYKDASDAVFAAGKQQAEAGAAEAGSQMAMAAADRGLLGSSRARGARGAIAAAQDRAVKDAATAAEDQADALRLGDESQLRALLESIVSPTAASGGIAAAATRGAEGDAQLTQLAAQSGEMYRSALSQALGSFLTNGVAGGINAGFARSDRRERRQMQQDQLNGWQGPSDERTWNTFEK